MGLGSVIREFGVKVSLLYDKKKVDDAKKGFDAFGGVVKKVGFQVAGLAGTMFGLAEITGQHGRELRNTAAMLGINVESLQKMQYAAKVVAGVTEEELTGAFEGLNQTLFEGRRGNSEALQTLSQLGITYTELQDPAMTADKLMMKLSNTFAAMPDGIHKTGLAMAAGGGALVKLLPMMNKGEKGWQAYGNEAKRGGLVFNEKQIKRMADFQEQISKLWFRLKNLTYVIGMELMGPVGAVVNDFMRWANANRAFIATNIAGVIKAMGIYLRLAWEAAKIFIAALQGLIAILGGTERAAKVFFAILALITGAQIIGGIVSLVGAFVSLVSILGVLLPTATAVGAAFTAFKSIGTIVTMVSTLADLVPAISLVGSALGAAVLPLLPWIAGITALGIAVHDIFQLIQGKPTWVGQGLDWAKQKIGGINESVFGSGDQKGASPFLAGAASGSAGYAGGGGAVTASSQAKAASAAGSTPPMNNTFNTEVNIDAKNGMHAGQLSDAVSTGVSDSHEASLRAVRNTYIGRQAY